jgi:hypothetical protein
VTCERPGRETGGAKTSLRAPVLDSFVPAHAVVAGRLPSPATLSGIYGELSWRITQRTMEIGIRVALDAQPSAVAGLVLKTVAAILRAAIGFLGAVGVVRLAASQIDMRTFGSFDCVAFGMGLLLAIAESLAGAWLPSRRAARIEPLSTPHYDGAECPRSLSVRSVPDSFRIRSHHSSYSLRQNTRLRGRSN